MYPRLATLLAAAFLAAVPALTRAADDDARAIVTKAIRAHGGQEVLAKFKAGQTKNKGTVKVPGVGEVEFTQEMAHMLPNKLKSTMDMEISNQKITVATLCNGDKYSLDVNGQQIEITDPIKQSLRDGIYLLRVGHLPDLLKDKAFQLAPLGEVKVEGKTAVGVRVSSKGHKDVSLYFDKKTNLLVKSEHRTVDASNGNEIRQEHIILEYKKDEQTGRPRPAKVRVDRDGEKFMEMEVQEDKDLEELPDSEFTR